MSRTSAAVHPAFRVNARRFGDSFRLRRNAGLAALIKRRCREMQRVGRFGWVQTPAFPCCWEPRAQLPLVHWFATPVRARLVARSSFGVSFGARDIDAARTWADQINLLTKAEVRALFPAAELHVERFVLWPKSYMIAWSPRIEPAQFGARSCAERTMAPAARSPGSRRAPWGRNGQYRSEPDR